MILFQQKFIIGVSSMEDAEIKAKDIQKEHPGSIICDVSKKIVKNKNVEYVRCEITLEYINERAYKKSGEITQD